MTKGVLEFPDTLTKKGKGINIDICRYSDNLIKIGGDEYILAYVNNKFKSNKGANSIVFALHSIDEFVDEDYDYSNPIKVIKISNTPLQNWEIPSRFQQEIDALKACAEKGVQNVIQVFETGVCSIQTQINDNLKRKNYLFYTMEYADFDLKTFLESTRLTTYEKVDLCLEISNGINELNKLGYYHRDLKPDNILISDSTWKIGDLGLVNSRNNANDLDKVSELIGPRGWYSPEALNKYLTESAQGEYLYDCIIDHQSDIFQLGKLFWFICQGNSPVGTVKTSDFKLKNTQLFSVIKTMLNHNKKRRYVSINEVIPLLKRIHKQYFKDESLS